MGMGKTKIPWVTWDSHGNGNTISHGNGIEVCCKWELRRASGKKSVHTVTSKHLQKALIAFKFISHAIIVQQY